jgi:Tfp pilus assembly protein PilN
MNPATNILPEIDFLPAEYREKRVRLQMQPWRLVVSTGLLALVALTAGIQHQRRQHAAEQLASIAPQYEAALKESTRYGQLQTQLAVARAEADLFTYLRYPWPRTRILDAILAPLPEEICLEELQIYQEANRERSGREPVDKTAEQKRKKMPPAVRDLVQLRQQYDKQQNLVVLTGTTREMAALHRYLGELAKMPLFAKAELASIETDTKSAKQADEQHRFSATLIVRPGYGQPGGPTPKDTTQSVAASPVAGAH